MREKNYCSTNLSLINENPCENEIWTIYLRKDRDCLQSEFPSFTSFAILFLHLKFKTLQDRPDAFSRIQSKAYIATDIIYPYLELFCPFIQIKKTYR